MGHRGTPNVDRARKLVRCADVVPEGINFPSVPFIYISVLVFRPSTKGGLHVLKTKRGTEKELDETRTQAAFNSTPLRLIPEATRSEKQHTTTGQPGICR